MAELPKEDAFGVLGLLFFVTFDSESDIHVIRGRRCAVRVK